MSEKRFDGSNVAIIGGLGFIGSALAHRLVDLNANVLVVDSLVPDSGGNEFNVDAIKDKIKIDSTDLRSDIDMAFVKNQDFIFNLAAQISHIDSMTDPVTDLDINCKGQLHLLEACRKHNPKVKIVYGGTRQVYGKPDSLPVGESHPIRPVDINGIHKQAAEWYHLLYHKVYGIKSCSLRLTNTYGPRQLMKHNRQGFIPWFIRQAIDEEEITIFGDGGQLRDLNYVEDVVDAFLLAAANEKSDGTVYNLGDDKPISLKEFVETLLQVCGTGSHKLVPFPKEKEKIDIGSIYSDFSKIKTELGWSPKTSLKDGLTLTVDYYKKHKKHYW